MFYRALLVCANAQKPGTTPNKGGLLFLGRPYAEYSSV